MADFSETVDTKRPPDDVRSRWATSLKRLKAAVEERG
jgi:hypothetical protein